MKKKLLALAVAGAFVAPAAMAADTGNVTIYGAVNASMVFADNGDATGGAAGTSSTRISSDQSKIGFKGKEGLGGDLSAIWQIESSINADTGSGGLAARNTFVGLSGESWGEVKLGNHDSPYKSATRGLDLFGDTIADNRSILGQIHLIGENLDQRNKNSLTYSSPNFSGIKLAVQYVAAAEGASNSTDKKGSSFSGSLAYSDGPITAAAAMVQAKAGSTGTGAMAAGTAGALGTAAVDDKITGLRLGGGYKMEAITVNAVYERIESDITVGALKVDAYASNSFYLGAKFMLNGSDAVKAAYVRRGELGDPSAANTKVSQWSLGFDHAMSGNTSVYALYTKMDNDDLSDMGISMASSDGIAATGAGAGPSAFAFGLKHSF